jgi:hypothetical protein
LWCEHTFGEDNIMAKRIIFSDSLVKICFVIVAVLFIWSAFDSVQASSNYHSSASYQLVYVNQGDTVWSIAAKHVDQNEDIRNLVAAIQQLNKLGKDVCIARHFLQPYPHIILPATVATVLAKVS